MSLGIGICLNNAKAVLEALLGKHSEFIRTPKFGLASPSDASWKAMTARPSGKFKLLPFVELLFGIYLLVCIVASLVRYRQITISIPFLVLFMAGYFYVGIATLRSLYPAPAPAVELPKPKPLPRTVSLPTGPLPEDLKISPESSTKTAGLPARQRL